MKTKARDIIAGWPKGRSTLPEIDAGIPWTSRPLNDAYHLQQTDMVEFYHRFEQHWLPTMCERYWTSFYAYEAIGKIVIRSEPYASNTGTIVGIQRRRDSAPWNRRDTI